MFPWRHYPFRAATRQSLDAIATPLVLGPLYECARRVLVSNVDAGALVRVFQNGVELRSATTSKQGSVVVPLASPLSALGAVTAQQWSGGIASAISAVVTVRTLTTLDAPRVMRPVTLGDIEVWVSHVTPGARVNVRSRLSTGTPPFTVPTTIGSVESAEPIVRVPTVPITDDVWAEAELCQLSKQGPSVSPISDPGAQGIFPATGDDFVSFGSMQTIATTVPDPKDPSRSVIESTSFSVDLRGQIYYPAVGGVISPAPSKLPLIVVAHGYWDDGDAVPTSSYLGYDYLARHLARWGILVFSVDLDQVTWKTRVATQQHARAQVIISVIDRLLADPSYGSRVDSDRIGLVGHSMGGEAVTLCPALAKQKGTFRIRGVVSIAPTHHIRERTLRETKYLQFLGSLDNLIQNAFGAPQLNGFPIYDRAWSPKTHCWIAKARHNPFNTVWLADGDKFEDKWANAALTPAEHQEIARSIINAFFQDAVADIADYAGYLEGTIVPPGVRALTMRIQHSSDPRTLITNFGDIDEQASSVGRGATATGSGTSSEEDLIQLHASAGCTSPQDTRALRLQWTAANFKYVTPTGRPGCLLPFPDFAPWLFPPPGIAIAATAVLSFRAAQFFPDRALNPADSSVDLFVSLSDGANVATLRAGSVAEVSYPDTAGVAAGLTSFQVLCPMQTVRLPVDAFKSANPDLDLEHVRSVELWCGTRETGDILVDDLEFSNV